MQGHDGDVIDEVAHRYAQGLLRCIGHTQDDWTPHCLDTNTDCFEPRCLSTRVDFVICRLASPLVVGSRRHGSHIRSAGSWRVPRSQRSVCDRVEDASQMQIELGFKWLSRVQYFWCDNGTKP